MVKDKAILSEDVSFKGRIKIYSKQEIDNKRINLFMQILRYQTFNQTKNLVTKKLLKVEPTSFSRVFLIFRELSSRQSFSTGASNNWKRRSKSFLKYRKLHKNQLLKIQKPN
jgi:hypothetical protein